MQVRITFITQLKTNLLLLGYFKGVSMKRSHNFEIVFSVEADVVDVCTPSPQLLHGSIS